MAPPAFPLPPGVIHVVRIDLDAAPDALGAALPQTEQARAGLIANPAARRRALAARGALYRILHAVGGDLPPGRVLDRSPNGRPNLPGGPDFSFSTSADLAVVALSERGPVGVDAEEMRSATWPPDWRKRHPALAWAEARHGGPGTGGRDGAMDALVAWSRLEAAAKACDRPLSGLLDLGIADLTADPCLARIAVRDVAVRGGYVCAAAFAGNRELRVMRAGWSEGATPVFTACGA